MSATERNRFVALDGLRGVAALLVVLYHLQIPNHLTNIRLIRNGYLAVDLFFILSGFVIYSSYASRIASVANFRRFICLRFFRVYPLHLATLIVLLGFELVKLWSQHSGLMELGLQAPFNGPNSPASFVENLALIQGLGVFDQLTWNVPSWSISCEFFAYLVFGILALSGWLTGRLAFLLFIAFGIAGYCFVVIVHGNLNATYDHGIIRCLAGFFLGTAIFRFTRHARETIRGQYPSIGIAQLALGAAFLLIASMSSGPGIIAVIPVFAGLVGLLQFDTGIVAKILMSPAVQFLGRISYSVYMVQYVFLYAETAVLKRVMHIPSTIDPVTLIPVLQTSQSIGDILAGGSLVFIVAISALTYRFIESPARNWGRTLLSQPARLATDV